ncbi:MAG: JAB domain-containing protein [Bacteroidia bacterium]|nr:JAB domain-containing protein [Bacteroidia bacterium]
METLSEISINYTPQFKLSECPIVISSKDADVQVRKVWSDKIHYLEESLMMLLNRANRLIGYTKLSIGGTTGTVVDLKVIFQTALKANAQSIILFHNHPSGNLKPSEADKTITKNIKEAGRLMEIPLLDHIIITSEGYFSFADEGLL